MKKISVSVGGLIALFFIIAFLLVTWAILIPGKLTVRDLSYDGVMYAYSNRHAWGNEIKLIQSNENNSSVDCRVQCIQDSNCQAAVYYKKDATPKKIHQCWLLSNLEKSKISKNNCCSIYSRNRIVE